MVLVGAARVAGGVIEEVLEVLHWHAPSPH